MDCSACSGAVWRRRDPVPMTGGPGSQSARRPTYYTHSSNQSVLGYLGEVYGGRNFCLAMFVGRQRHPPASRLHTARNAHPGSRCKHLCGLAGGSPGVEAVEAPSDASGGHFAKKTSKTRLRNGAFVVARALSFDPAAAALTPVARLCPRAAGRACFHAGLHLEPLEPCSLRSGGGGRPGASAGGARITPGSRGLRRDPPARRPATGGAGPVLLAAEGRRLRSQACHLHHHHAHPRQAQVALHARLLPGEGIPPHPAPRSPGIEPGPTPPDLPSPGGPDVPQPDLPSPGEGRGACAHGAWEYRRPGRQLAGHRSWERGAGWDPHRHSTTRAAGGPDVIPPEIPELPTPPREWPKQPGPEWPVPPGPELPKPPGPELPGPGAHASLPRCTAQRAPGKGCRPAAAPAGASAHMAAGGSSTSRQPHGSTPSICSICPAGLPAPGGPGFLPNSPQPPPPPGPIPPAPDAPPPVMPAGRGG